MEKHYVLGLAFSETGNQMAAILKDRPEFQKGKVNGIGGKVEPKENHFNAISREFFEETGVLLDEWGYFCKLQILNDVLGGVAIIHCYTLFSNHIFSCRTMESEKVDVYTVADLCNKLDVAPNLPMLIQIALNKNLNFSHIVLNK